MLVESRAVGMSVVEVHALLETDGLSERIVLTIDDWVQGDLQ